METCGSKLRARSLYTEPRAAQAAPRPHGRRSNGSVNGERSLQGDRIVDWFEEGQWFAWA